MSNARKLADVSTALDNYETGTCTFTNITGYSASGWTTPTNLSHLYGHYVKIGNMVTIQGAIQASYGAGRVAVSFDLPFATFQAANQGLIGTCSFYPNETNGSSGYIIDYTGGNSTQCFMVHQTSASGTNKTISMSLTYRISAD